MERLKRIIIRMLFPPVWLAVLIALPSFALVIWVLATGQTGSVWAYVSYPASAYATVVLSVNAPRMVRFFRNFAAHPLVQKARSHPQGERLLNDPMYRAEIGLYAGLLINLLYAAVKLVSGIVYHSLWFGALAGYYMLLSLLRYALLHHARRNPVGQNALSEWKRYRLCGAMLLVMNQALAVVVALVVYRNSGFEYPGYLIYVMAMYTFYAVVHAVRSMFKFKKRGSPVLLAAKVVSFVAALVSLLSLETAMLTQFGSADDPTFRRIMTGGTGAAVCIIVLSMAVYMIIRSTKQIRYLKGRKRRPVRR